MNLEDFLNDLPLLHNWDGEWNSGGFTRAQLAATLEFVRKHIAERPKLIETGAGNSTIAFLLLNPGSVVSIAPDADLFARIRRYCDEHEIDHSKLEAHVNSSHLVLPPLAEERSEFFDFALIDGCHGWPLVFVDFCYLSILVREGGFIMLDDVPLHSVKELVRLLTREPSFRLVLNLGKSVIFQKITSGVNAAEWTAQAYIVDQSRIYRTWPDPSALNAPSTMTLLRSLARRIVPALRRRIVSGFRGPIR